MVPRRSSILSTHLLFALLRFSNLIADEVECHSCFDETAIVPLEKKKEPTRSIDPTFAQNECQECKEDQKSTEIRLKGVVLIACQEAMLSREELDDICGLVAKDVAVPGKWYEFEAWMEPLYCDRPLDDETIQNIKEGIVNYFESKAYPFIVVTIPPQNISSGVLQIEVEESTIGAISIEGNRWTHAKTLQNYLSFSVGDRIDESRLLKDVEFMNRNPFRRVDAIYSAGEHRNQTDITLAVRDEKIYHLYAGTDNTGVPTTGRNRYFVGLNWNQIFGLDHVLFYQYTTSQSFRSFQAHTLQYLAFLPTKTILNLYGGYSTVHAHLSAPTRKNSGQTAQGSLRHTAPLNGTPPFVHEVTLGFDFKQTNNTVEFVDYDPVFANTVNLTQLMGGYRLKYTAQSNTNDLNFEFYLSPGRWLPDQRNSNFSGLRPGAKNHWVYLRGSWKQERSLPKAWKLILLSRFEWASIPLLPSEQLGIGGYESVRGYDERQLDADTGGFLSAELRTPSFRLFTKRTASMQDSMLFLLFFEGGVSYDKVAVPLTKALDYVTGIGPGVRYNYSSYLNARLDMGFKLHNRAKFTGGSPMLHFSVIGNY